MVFLLKSSLSFHNSLLPVLESVSRLRLPGFLSVSTSDRDFLSQPGVLKVNGLFPFPHSVVGIILKGSSTVALLIIAIVHSLSIPTPSRASPLPGGVTQ